MRLLIVLAVMLTLPGLTRAVEVREKGAAMSANEELNADSLLDVADTVFQSRDYAAALDKYLEVLEVARIDFNRPVETECLAQVARCNLILNNKEEGRTWLIQAKERASDSDPMGWSRYLGVRGRFEWQDNDLIKARKTFNDMYVYCNTNGLWSRAVDAAHMIAIVAESPEEQIEWSRRGIEAAESGGVESWLGPLWNNLAVTYDENKQYDSSLECFTKAREYHWRFSGEVGKLFADYHIGMTYRKLGDFENAGKWLRPVLAWAERLENHSAIGQATEDLGEIEIAEGRKSAGLKMLKRARDEYKAEGYDKTWPEIWNAINDRIKGLEGN